MSAGVIYTSRAEVVIHRFAPTVLVLATIVALFLQGFLPVAFGGRLHFLGIFDLPLLVTVFFALARRNPVTGTITGCVIGLMQDALSAGYIGLFGMAKTVVGYTASSLAGKIDVENPGSRLLLVSGFYLLQRVVYLVVERGLVRDQVSVEWLHSLGAAFANGLLAIAVFSLLDRFKRRS